MHKYNISVGSFGDDVVNKVRLEDESAGSVSTIVDGSKLTIMVEGGDLNLKTLKVIIPIATVF